MFRPRPYLSFSQMTKFETSPERYIAEYVRKEPQRISRNMAYGSQLAEGLAKEEANGDPLLDLMASRLPKFEIMDRPIEVPLSLGPENCEKVWYERDKKEIVVPVLKYGRGKKIPLLAVPDTMKPDMSAFKEYKTSVRKWSQKMADQSGQVTFYATVIWIITGKLPEYVELVNVPVAYQPGGELSPTGELVCLQTKRTMVDVIKMCSRIKKTWQGIGELCEKEMF